MGNFRHRTHSSSLLRTSMSPGPFAVYVAVPHWPFWKVVGSFWISYHFPRYCRKGEGSFFPFPRMHAQTLSLHRNVRQRFHTHPRDIKVGLNVRLGTFAQLDQLSAGREDGQKGQRDHLGELHCHLHREKQSEQTHSELLQEQRWRSCSPGCVSSSSLTPRSFIQVQHLY